MSGRRPGVEQRTVSLDEALRLVMGAARPGPPEWVSLEAARGRHLAAPVKAPFDLWPFPRAAMDGFAVRTCDLEPAAPDRPVTLEVAGTAYAGDPSPAPVGRGQAVRIMTGAVVPDGADGVVPLEAAEEDQSPDGRAIVRVRRPLSPGKNVLPRGEDARAGETLLSPGVPVTPATLGLMAAIGASRVLVYPRPRAAVLAVGDELLDPKTAGGEAAAPLPRPGQVFDANSAVFAALLSDLGCEVIRLGVVGDRLDALEDAVRRGLGADLLVISGGASVGDRDFTLQALAAAGCELSFTRLLIKPGKAVAFGRAGRCLAFALPGSPGAALTAFWLLVAPAVRALLGSPPEHCGHPRVRARLMAPVRVSRGRPHYLWGKLVLCRGMPAVWPVGPPSTAVLRPQAVANALIEVPAEAGALDAGAEVAALSYDARTPPPTVDWPAVPVVSVVGPHNAGKTTLLEALIPELSARGIRAAVLKHDVHSFQMDYEGKDTWRLSRSGAAAVGISGPTGAAVLYHGGERDLDDLVAMLAGGVRLVLTEGYKSARTPKIEVVPEGQEPLSSPEQLLAVVTRGPRPDRPGWIPAHDVGAVARRLEGWLEGWERQARQRVGAF